MDEVERAGVTETRQYYSPVYFRTTYDIQTDTMVCRVTCFVGPVAFTRSVEQASLVAQIVYESWRRYEASAGSVAAALLDLQTLLRKDFPECEDTWKMPLHDYTAEYMPPFHQFPVVRDVLAMIREEFGAKEL